MTDPTPIPDPAQPTAVDVRALDAPPQGRKVHSEARWASARDAYLDGEAGASVAARHGISPTAFWSRAAADGWRRRDRPAAPPPAFDPEAQVLDDAAQIALIDRRISWALQAGADAAALRWMRMRDRIQDRELRLRQAEERERRAADRRALAEIGQLTGAVREVERMARIGLSSVETEMRLHRLQARRGKAPTPAGPESPESKNSASTPPDPDAPGLSRAERRRRLKYAAKHVAGHARPPPD